MGIARDLALDRAQPEPLGGVIGGRAQPPVIEGQRLGAPTFEEQLAVLGPRGGPAQHRKCGGLVDLRLEGGETVLGHGDPL